MSHTKHNPDKIDSKANTKATHTTDKSWIKPEWIRLPDATRVSGMCRSSLYEVIGSGEIKSFCKRTRGSKRGTRLISYDSLVEYLEQKYSESLSQHTSA